MVIHLKASVFGLYDIVNTPKDSSQVESRSTIRRKLLYRWRGRGIPEPKVLKAFTVPTVIGVIEPTQLNDRKLEFVRKKKQVGEKYHGVHRKTSSPKTSILRGDECLGRFWPYLAILRTHVGEV